jgi:hypothetical protein
MTDLRPASTRRRVALAIGTPLALLAIGWVALTGVAWAGQGSYRMSETVTNPGHAVAVSVDSGQLTVGPAAGTQLRLQVTAHYALVRSTVRADSGPSGLSIHERCHQLTGPCSFTSAVSVPARARAAISVGSGQLTARGLAGRITLTDHSGQIEALALTGVTRIRNDSGNIAASDLSGASLLVQDQSGDISLTGLSSQDVTVSDQSGDVTVTFAKVPGQVRITNQSGDVQLVLPAGPTAYHVSAHTAAGRTFVGVPTSSSSAHVITVSDDSGDVTIVTS